ncbi:MAG: DUF4373 domain-containing protein [bacterium]|nr:DUF4373 domain-containing protein [bacterium]
MARPIKNNADFYKHDNDMRNNDKIRAIRTKFGLEGYAVWCMILEKLCRTNHFKLKYNPLKLELLAGDFDIPSEKLEQIIAYFLKIELLQQEDNPVDNPVDNFLYCRKLTESMQILIRKRKLDRNGVIDVDNSKETGLSTSITQKNGVIDVESTQIRIDKNRLDTNKDTIPKSKCMEANEKIVSFGAHTIQNQNSKYEEEKIQKYENISMVGERKLSIIEMFEMIKLKNFEFTHLGLTKKTSDILSTISGNSFIFQMAIDKCINSKITKLKYLAGIYLKLEKEFNKREKIQGWDCWGNEVNNEFRYRFK